VPFKIIYLVVRLVAALAVLVFRRDLAKEAELLVLRHENAVLRRRAGRIRYEPADRVWFTALMPWQVTFAPPELPARAQMVLARFCGLTNTARDEDLHAVSIPSASLLHIRELRWVPTGRRPGG
jgi:hypothetical protein